MKILIVALQHGNEVFGKNVVEHFKDTDVDTIIANPKAYEQNKRFIDTDMNRSFHRLSPAGYEETRAVEVLSRAKKYDFVIDIHTTTSPIDFVPIIAKLNSEIELALSHLHCENIAQMVFSGVKHSLIGSLDSSISLEFNEDFAAKKNPIHIVENMIKGLQSGKVGDYTEKAIYNIVGTISDSKDISADEENFKLSKKHGFYPFLIGEENYHDYKGFYANEVSSVSIR